MHHPVANFLQCKCVKNYESRQSYSKESRVQFFWPTLQAMRAEVCCNLALGLYEVVQQRDVIGHVIIRLCTDYFLSMSSTLIDRNQTHWETIVCAEVELDGHQAYSCKSAKEWHKQFSDRLFGCSKLSWICDFVLASKPSLHHV